MLKPNYDPNIAEQDEYGNMTRKEEVNELCGSNFDDPNEDTEICNECGRSVKGGSGFFVNRIPDLNSVEERKEMGKQWPYGGWVCSACDEKTHNPETHGFYNTPAECENIECAECPLDDESKRKIDCPYVGEPDKTTKTAQCENHCPKCDNDDIEWGVWDLTDNVHFIGGKCPDCGCVFKEYRSYKETEWEG